MECPSCARELPDGAVFCPACATPVDLSSTPTLTSVNSPVKGAAHAAVPRAGSESESHRPPSSASNFGYEARYVPGTTLANRYRIVSPLGKGGMGEVYRADDLKLGQTVALKFLSRSLALNAEGLDRFTREVRLARQVSHPNVCRVFDIGEASGQTFLTMEFVDGEDIASLMRRIGRLPADKALEIARQMCAGLAAAHEHGIIHRDLKPANIMLDGRGRARITDFGLASLSAEIKGEEARSGTPAYMSPEQFSSGQITPSSDIYSLGLVMYEIFTGKRPFEGSSTEEMARLRDKSTPVTPSQYVRELDPRIERVMLRCLEKDPAQRPASALQVAAALPGGDPLAAALAAGETPSPQMVAASGEKEGLRPAIAWGCLLLIVLGLAAAAVLADRVMVLNLVPLPSPPEVLAAKASDISRQLGYTTLPVDTAFGFVNDYAPGYLRYVKKNDRSLTRWNNISSGIPPIITFWYRASPKFMWNRSFDAFASVGPDDPSNSISGMCQMILDTRGHLIKFEAVPPQIDTSTEAAPAPSWDVLFAAAGLDANQFRTSPPRWTPLATTDTRAAWEGIWPGHPELSLHVEAAAYRGKPVYFNLVSPWTKPDRTQDEQEGAGLVFVDYGAILLTVFFSIVTLGVVLARRNIRSGRGDRVGAARLALMAFLMVCIGVFLGAHHIPTLAEFMVLMIAIGWGLIAGALAWLLYVALEPHARKRWPRSLISWSRLLAGNVRDPAVGRDLMVGALTGVFFLVSGMLEDMVPRWMGKMPPEPLSGGYDTLSSVRAAIGDVMVTIMIWVFVSFILFFIFFLMRVMVRKEWLAVVLMTFLISLLYVGNNPLHTAFMVIVWSINLIVLTRFGLLALVVAFCTEVILSLHPLTTHLSAWYAEQMFLSFVLILAAAVFGFYTSTAGKQRFGGLSFDD